jgi:hypothetical protein
MSNIAYHPKKVFKGSKRMPGYTIPAKVTFVCHYQDYEDTTNKDTHTFHDEDVRDKTVVQALANGDLFPETVELRRRYLKETERFQSMFVKIGRQYLAHGNAHDLTDRKRENDDHRWWRSDNRDIVIAPGSRVVIDVIDEAKDGAIVATDNHRVTAVTQTYSAFWKVASTDDDTPSADEDDEEEFIVPPEIPIHHYLIVFHLTKHLRLKVHASQLKKYAYDEGLIDKLVLDEDRKALVKLLIHHRDSKYVDIIGEKSGGAIVMLCGRAGTGKTLTAEVFAESERRALYRVQCAQLTPGDKDRSIAAQLEDELLKVLTRAARWGAVLLLDEADVYVRRRGDDFDQNAVVGVFLRVLEYMNSIMFMTTNRAEDIDDAIASRCTAKLVYRTPSVDEQCNIWSVLTATAHVKMSKSTIRKVAEKYPDLSGRDVNKLLQLAMLVTKGKKITSRTIDFVRQFKSTD